ncbi:hypothetical protein [Actinomadura sp. 9N407]|uniref:hypothetical protein n=1 Tax=Actinomadura sp. 9N407 TaxID=3375154 RepID=UPI0037954739
MRISRSPQVSDARTQADSVTTATFNELGTQSWLHHEGQALDECSSTAAFLSLGEWGPVECRRTATYYFTVEEDLCRSVERLHRRLGEAGWSSPPPSCGQDDSAQQCGNEPRGVYGLKKPAQKNSYGIPRTEWGDHSCPPSGNDNAATRVKPLNDAEGVFRVEYRPLDIRTLAARVLKPGTFLPQ